MSALPITLLIASMALYNQNNMKKIIIIICLLFLTGCQKSPDRLGVKITEPILREKYNQATEIKAKYKLDGVSLVKTEIKNPALDKYKGEPKDEIKITLGDKDKTEFAPNIEMKRWNEVFFKLKTDNLLKNVAAKDKNLFFENNKIKYETPKISFEMYDVPAIEIDEDSYKYIWYLNSKPTTNKVEFEIFSEGLDFFRQPPLTEEYQNGYSEEFQKEIVVSETQVKDLEGNVLVERPENVIGSYAVYHQTKGGMNDIYGKDYKAGKAFHIYRPHIIDANGAETWGILKIENGIYSVEIPQEFLNKAVYPIKSNDTFGRTTVGASNSGITDTEANVLAVGDSYTAVAGDIITKFSMAGYSAAGTSGFDLAAYTSNGSVPVSRLAAGITVNCGTSLPIVAFKDSSAVSQAMAGGSVYVVAFGNDGAFTEYIAQDSVGQNESSSDASTGALPASWTHRYYNFYRFSIYATYTPSGGGGTPIPKDNIWWDE